MVEAKTKNLNRTTEEQAKNLVFKIVGERGRRREILVPLRPGEMLDPEGRVVEQEHRVGGGRSSWARHHHASIPSSSANLEPLGQRDGRTSGVQHNMGEEGNTMISQEEVLNISTSSRVSDLVEQFEKRRGQQQVIGGGATMGRVEGVVEGQTGWQWEVVDNSQRGFKSKRGDRSLSASPTLVKKGRNGPLRDWAGRVVGEQE